MREPIFAALATLLGGTPGIMAVERRLRLIKDLKPADMPRLALVPAKEAAARGVGRPNGTLIIEALAVLYVQEDRSAGRAAGQVLLDRLDAIETQLAGSPLHDGRQTLGGLVHHCYIADPLETDEGAFGQQAAAFIPIRIHTQP